MPKRKTPVRVTKIRCSGGSCPHVEIDWEHNSAVIVDDFGGECHFTSLSQLWSLASRINIAMCEPDSSTDLEE
jgi:hypothetical protein